MDNELAEKFRGNEMAQEAAEIAARCVQCGQCTVNCPTFRILNNADLALKGSKRQPGLVLEEAILELCRPT